MAYVNKIDTAKPDGGDDPREADDNMRRIQAGFQEILDVEHNVDLTGTEITGDGKHTDINCDSLTSAGAISGTTIDGTGDGNIGGTLDVVGNIDPTSYETTRGGFKDEDDMGSDSATKVASQQSIKAYIDAQILANIPSGLTGIDESIGELSIGELQLKWGDKAIPNGNALAITFVGEGLSAFSNNCFQVIPGDGQSTGTPTYPFKAYSITKNGFTVKGVDNTTRIVRWFAIGR